MYHGVRRLEAGYGWTVKNADQDTFFATGGENVKWTSLMLWKGCHLQQSNVHQLSFYYVNNLRRKMFYFQLSRQFCPILAQNTPKHAYFQNGVDNKNKSNNFELS